MALQWWHTESHLTYIAISILYAQNFFNTFQWQENWQQLCKSSNAIKAYTNDIAHCMQRYFSITSTLDLPAYIIVMQVNFLFLVHMQKNNKGTSSIYFCVDFRQNLFKLGVNVVHKRKLIEYMSLYHCLYSNSKIFRFWNILTSYHVLVIHN